MNAVLDSWSLLNTVVIMLGLGLNRETTDTHALWSLPVLRVVIGYNLLVPALAILILQATAWFSAATLAAMSLCVACAGGTSAGAFVTQVKGSPTLAVTLIVGALGASLITIALFSQWHWIDLGTRSLLDLTAYLFAITLIPLWAGYALRHYFPAGSAQWQPRVERLGSLLVILLVIALAIRYGTAIITGPSEPLVAAVMLVLIFALPPFIERAPTYRRTAVIVTLIRNLTLVLSLLAVLPNAETLMPTVLAFGLFMYLMTGLLVWHWRVAPGP